MLETVIALSIIGTLTALAVPKVARSLDNVCVDYEIRCLHSMLHYTQSVSRLSQYSTFKFNTPTGYSWNYMECRISGNAPLQYYDVKRPSTGSKPSVQIKENHYLERNVQINNPIGSSFQFRVNGEFNTTGGTLVISKGEFTRYLVLTNYGRIRMSNKQI